MSDTFDTFGITGIPPPSDAEVKTKTIPYAINMPLRYEVSDSRWSTDPTMQKQWTLFVLGMESFMKKPVTDKLSFFQVAGIHGYPATQWDGAPPPKKDPISDTPAPGAPPYGGYCHHNTVAFPTWHRPYLLLFEQCLWLNMKEVIGSWNLAASEAKTWTDAADSWRLPYWDYAATPVPTLPKCFTVKDVEIWPPTGTKTKIPNPYPSPFWVYENPEKKPDGTPYKFGFMPRGKEQYSIKADTQAMPFMPWNHCSGVSRYGVKLAQDGTYTGLQGNNDVTLTNKALEDFANLWYSHAKESGSLQDAAKRLLTQGTFKSWGTFATTKWNAEQAVSEYLSLEFIHNNVHNITGGSNYYVKPGDPGQVGIGHMCDVPVAAFDPIFWLHHCTVDRWTAIFQILNWNLWFDKEPVQPNEVPDIKSTDPLIPFHMTAGAEPDSNFWTSDLVRDWTKLHYQYDDLIPSASAINPDGSLNESKYIDEIQQHVHKIYKSSSRVVHNIMADPDISNTKFLGADDGTWNDYVITVKYDRYALDGRSYTILFYLGGKKDDPESAFANPKNYVGQVYNFAGMPPVTNTSAPNTGCANCGAQNDGAVLSSAQVPLTAQVVYQALDDGFKNIQHTTRKEVAEYLKGFLHWKFVRVGGADVPASELPLTEVSVWCGKGYNEPGQPASYSDYESIDIATEGKACGVTSHDA